MNDFSYIFRDFKWYNHSLARLSSIFLKSEFRVKNGTTSEKSQTEFSTASTILIGK